MSQKIGVKDALTVLSIAYYLDGNIRDLHAAFHRNKNNMTNEAFNVMYMMISSKNPIQIMEAGLREMQNQP